MNFIVHQLVTASVHLPAEAARLPSPQRLRVLDHLRLINRMNRYCQSKATALRAASATVVIPPSSVRVSELCDMLIAAMRLS